jgi:hypothetical protein
VVSTAETARDSSAPACSSPLGSRNCASSGRRLPDDLAERFGRVLEGDDAVGERPQCPLEGDESLEALAEPPELRELAVGPGQLFERPIRGQQAVERAVTGQEPVHRSVGVHEPLDGAIGGQHVVEQAAVGDQPFQRAAGLQQAVKGAVRRGQLLERPVSGQQPLERAAGAQQAIDDPSLGHQPVQGATGGEQALEDAALGQQLVQRASRGQSAAERTILGGEHRQLLDPCQRPVRIAEPAKLLDRTIGGEQDADPLLVASGPADGAVRCGEAAGGDDQLRAGDRGPGRQRGDREQPHGGDPTGDLSCRR